MKIVITGLKRDKAVVIVDMTIVNDVHKSMKILIISLVRWWHRHLENITDKHQAYTNSRTKLINTWAIKVNPKKNEVNLFNYGRCERRGHIILENTRIKWNGQIKYWTEIRLRNGLVPKHNTRLSTKKSITIQNNSIASPKLWSSNLVNSSTNLYQEDCSLLKLPPKEHCQRHVLSARPPFRMISEFSIFKTSSPHLRIRTSRRQKTAKVYWGNEAKTTTLSRHTPPARLEAEFEKISTRIAFITFISGTPHACICSKHDVLVNLR